MKIYRLKGASRTPDPSDILVRPDIMNISPDYDLGHQQAWNKNIFQNHKQHTQFITICVRAPDISVSYQAFHITLGVDSNI